MAKVWVVDTETTGTDPEHDKIVEIGAVLLDGPEVLEMYESLVNPGIPIPPQSSAIHHLTDKDVAEAPSLDAAIMPLLERDFDYVVAHNAGFDSKFLDLGQVDWICTWKLAMRVIQDAPSYSNQALRYFLGLPGPTSKTHAHRALYDAEVTAQLFAHILGMAQSDDPYPGMVEVSNNPVILKGKLGFGKHAEMTWDQVPSGYLKWIADQPDMDENKRATARHWLSRK